MTGDPWQENAPNQVVLFQLIDMHVFALPAETKRAVDAIIAAGWQPPPKAEPHGCACPCHRPK